MLIVSYPVVQPRSPVVSFGSVPAAPRPGNRRHHSPAPATSPLSGSTPLARPSRMKLPALLLSLATPLAGAQQCPAATVQSGAAVPLVVELYTS